MAWYHSTPENSKIQRGKSIPDNLKEFPSLIGGEYLLEYLFDLGISHSDGYGQNPIKYTEIKAYCDLVSIDLSPFEVKTIRELSVAYCNQASISTKKDAFAPYTKKELSKDEVSNKLKNAFTTLRKRS